MGPEFCERLPHNINKQSTKYTNDDENIKVIWFDIRDISKSCTKNFINSYNKTTNVQFTVVTKQQHSNMQPPP